MADSSVIYQGTVATPPSGTEISTRTNLSSEHMQVVLLGVDGSDSVAGGELLISIDGKLPDETGAWGYKAGVSGTVVLTGAKRLLGIAASAPSAGAGSMTINGGDAIVIPAAGSVMFAPRANLVDATIVLTATDSYIIEYVA